MVCVACGALLGYSSATAADPDGLTVGGVARAIPGTWDAVSRIRENAATSVGLLIAATSSNGPLNPGPNPLAEQVICLSCRGRCRVSAGVVQAEP